MNKINKFLVRYGSQFLIACGIFFILVGLILQYKGVATFENYNYRSRYNSQIKSTTNTSTHFSYVLGIGLVLLGFKRDWFFKKKPKSKSPKVLKLKRDRKALRKESKITRKNKVIRLDNDVNLRVNED